MQTGKADNPVEINHSASALAFSHCGSSSLNSSFKVVITEEEMIYWLLLTCLSLCRLEPASWFPVTFTKMYIPSFRVSDVKSGPIVNLLIVIHCSVQKDFFKLSMHVLD